MPSDLDQPHIAIRASAGTGKTYQLTSRYLQLLAGGVNPSHILALTFSRKAAGELLERLLQRLALAATQPSQARQLGQAIGRADLTCRQAADLLAALVGCFHRLQVGTLDSFFHRLAGAFALELGLPMTWQIADGQADLALRRQAVEALLDDDQPQQLVEWLRLLCAGKPVRSVVSTVHKAIDSFHELYCQAPDPAAWDWLTPPQGLTADQLARAVENLEDIEQHVPCTREGLPRQKWSKAVRELLEMIRAGQWESFVDHELIKRIMTGHSQYDRADITEQFVAYLQPFIDHASHVLLKQWSDYNHAAYRLLDRFDAHYRRLQQRHGLLCFADVTRTLARAGLTQTGQDIYFRLDAAINHLLIDEFQDTSIDQWAILRPIAEELTAYGRLMERSFFCVGDIKQSIYGWRSGEPRLFDVLDRHCHNALHWEDLTTSYRSSPVIINAVNTVFDGIENSQTLCDFRNIAQAWAASFQPHDTVKKQLPGYVELNVVSKAEPDDVSHQHEQAILAAVERIVQLHQQAPHCSLGVLVRTNATLGRIIFELRRRGVAASEEGGNPLTDSPAVNAVLSLLRLADHPGDSASAFHVAASPLGPVVGLNRPFDPPDDSETHQLAYHVRRQLLEDGYGPTLHRWAMDLARHCDQRNFRRLGQLVRLGHEHDRFPSLRTRDFIDLVESTGVEDPTNDPVRVMTIHKAKGLQFDAVVLPELHVCFRPNIPDVLVHRQDDIGPIARLGRYPKKTLRSLCRDFDPMLRQYNYKAVRDSLSLLYVALTRARCAAYLFLWPPGKAAGRRRPSYADLLNETLAPHLKADEADPTVLTTGDPCWYERLEQQAPRPTRPLYRPRIRLARSTGRRLGPVHSPSELAGQAGVDLAGELSGRREAATRRGTVFHRWYESIGWLDRDGPPDRQTLRQTAVELGAPSASLDDWLDRFFDSLAKPDVRKTLCSDGFHEQAQLHRELPFVIRDGRHLLTGAIDRLVIEPDRALVIDFKTDTPPRNSEQMNRLVEHYRPQLEAYRRAVSHLTGLALEDVEACLLLVGSGRLVRL